MTTPTGGLAHESMSVAAVFDVAKAAGFRGQELIVAVAISLAENESSDPDLFGDVSLADKKWGPSVGLWQIRALNADFATGRTRDQKQLRDPAFNARSAYSISNGGRDFGWWSTYDASKAHPKNNGRYRTFMQAASQAFANAPEGAVDSGAITPTITADAGIPIAAASHGGAAVPLTIGGRKLTGDLGDAVISGTVDLSTDEVSEVTVTLLDPGYELSRKYRLDLDSIIHCLDLPFRVVGLSCGQHPAGPTVSLRAHPAGAVTLRLGTPAAMSNVSPTEYMAQVVQQAGLRFVGQASGTRSSLGPNQINDSTTNATRPETAWEVGARLADELGYYAFECAGTYYFAAADYLIHHARRVQIAKGDTKYATGTHGPVFEALEVPDCEAVQSRSVPALLRKLPTDITLCDVQISAKVNRDNGEQLRPATSVVFSGVSPKFEGFPQMITRVSWDLVNTLAPVQVEAGTFVGKSGTLRTPEDIIADPTDPSITTYFPARGGPVGSGISRSALDFVTVCLRQVNDSYVWGAEAQASDPDPSAFDCSELVEWGCSRVGLRFVDGSAAQYAAIVKAKKTITVAEAARIRGALLFIGDPVHHVAISLGDGRNTVEAKGAKYGVVSGGAEGVIGNRFSRAGLIPGMVYG